MFRNCDIFKGADTWDSIDCEKAKPCPSGDDKECPKRQQCFSGATCGGSSDDIEQNDPIVTDKITSQFFCGVSWSGLVESCDSATPCPSGTNAGKLLLSS